ncbi:MAG TPA: hypothetical protein VJ953_20065 [Saprospiraceae bacterium]|nr:hypothetical protein [Saprospiraceae bacterium]
MEDKKLNQLLERYFAGESSLEEENQLRTLLQSRDLPEKWLPYQAIFQGLEQEAAITLPSDIEKEILAQIESETAPRIRQITWKPLLRYAAAVAVLLIAITWWTNSLSEPETTAGIDWSKYEPETPEEAAKVYRDAILKLSTALNNGANSAAKNVKRVETVGQFFE